MSINFESGFTCESSEARQNQPGRMETSHSEGTQSGPLSEPEFNTAVSACPGENLERSIIDQFVSPRRRARSRSIARRGPASENMTALRLDSTDHLQKPGPVVHLPPPIRTLAVRPVEPHLGDRPVAGQHLGSIDLIHFVVARRVAVAGALRSQGERYTPTFRPSAPCMPGQLADDVALTAAPLARATECVVPSARGRSRRDASP